jgi:hypothetical protein
MDGKLEVRQTISLEQYVDALFKDDGTRKRARALLGNQGYYEISATDIETEAIEAIFKVLESGAAKKLVNDLRDRSKNNKAPFQPRDRKVTLSISEQVPSGEATICERNADDLHNFIEFASADETTLLYVKATSTRGCRGERDIVEVNPVDWRTLEPSGNGMVEAEARVYLHRPNPPRRADDTPFLARADG